jgi:WhiB family transcriptional regulator, redox-sensing transcriptional regulator
MDLSALITRGFAMSDRALWLLMVERGACSISELSPDDWYPVSASAEAARGEAAGAIAVCTACPVREECLELALRNWAVGQHGVWGGTVPVERERLRAARVAQLTRVLARNRGAGLAASRDADRAASLSPLRGGRMLKTNDGLAVQPAMAEIFEHLPGAIEVNGGTDPRGDRAVREHLPDRGQPLGRDQGIRAGRMALTPSGWAARSASMTSTDWLS